MRTMLKLSKDENGVSVDLTLYRSKNGSLLYLTTSRPDIYYSISVCARYQSNLKQPHITAVKRIIRYVSGTLNYGIWYSKDFNMSLAGFSDADWARDADERKSTRGSYFYFRNSFVSWHNKNQKSISLSTADAKYIVVDSCWTQLLWMKQMLTNYGIVLDSFTVFCDNTSTINILKNPV